MRVASSKFTRFRKEHTSRVAPANWHASQESSGLRVANITQPTDQVCPPFHHRTARITRWWVIKYTVC